METRKFNKTRGAKAIMFLLALLGALVLAPRSPISVGVPYAHAGSCDYDDNLSDLAQSFIGRCCRGGINSEFPGEYYNVTLGTIKSKAQNSVGQAKKAYKLLNDNRFRK